MAAPLCAALLATVFFVGGHAAVLRTSLNKTSLNADTELNKSSVNRTLMNRTTFKEKATLATYTFDEFVSDFARDYSFASREYQLRAAHFQASIRRVIALNAVNEQEDRTWKAGINPFMDWSETEKINLNGYKPSRMQGNHNVAALQAEFGVASNKSWRDNGASWEGVALRQQGNCGSCWAISAVEAVEARLPEKNRLAAQALVDCVPNPQHCGGKGGCDGATGELAYTFMRDHGLPLENDYPYAAQTGSCPMNPLQGSFPSPRRARVSGWTALPSNKAEPLLQALYSQGPVVVAVDANDWFDYDNGVFDSCKKDAELGHAVLAKGYGGEGKLQYWRIQNSWGANWGEQGHIRLKRRDAKEEEAYCGQDKNPQDGVGCDGGPAQVTVCGQCGILYDPLYPNGVTLESSSDQAAAAQPAAFRGSKKKVDTFDATLAKFETFTDEDDSSAPDSARDSFELAEGKLVSSDATESNSAPTVKSAGDENPVDRMHDIFRKQ
jgi:cathepsin L